MTEKVLIFDAGPIIGFSMNGLMPELKKLKEVFPGKFIITKEVKEEIIDRPITIKRFELEALKTQELINDGTIEFPESLGIKEEEITRKTEELLDIANNTYKQRGKSIHLIDKGETSILVLSKMLEKKDYEQVLVVDERTTRMLCEKPENLKKLLQKKLHVRVDIKRENLENFRGFKIVRSCELAYMIYKNGLFRLKSPKILDAALYGLKYKGCSISNEEIDKLKKLA
jgi:hypothetical protein